MAEHEEKKGESLMEKVAEKIHGGDSSSSSDSEDEKPSELKAKIYRLFGRERPVHQVFGGGKCKSILQFSFSKSSSTDDRKYSR